MNVCLPQTETHRNIASTFINRLTSPPTFAAHSFMAAHIYIVYAFIYRLYIGKEFYKLTKSFSASLTILCFICKLPRCQAKHRHPCKESQTFYGSSVCASVCVTATLVRLSAQRRDPTHDWLADWRSLQMPGRTASTASCSAWSSCPFCLCLCLCHCPLKHWPHYSHAMSLEI